jgi:ribonuclease BN (tRNA processing enzyme)
VTSFKATILGSGDAFCSGGRANSAMRIDAGGQCLALEFGATALLSWKRAGYATSDIDAVAVSHLHGDHFGGLPFLMLDCEFISHRKKPLRFVGPKGLRARLVMAMEVLFPGSSAIHWSFPWEVVEITPEDGTEAAGFKVSCLEVIHPSGAPALGLRIARGGKLLAFSGDTSWTPNLVKIASKADLFICECFSGDDMIPNHLSWDVLQAHLAELKAKQIVLTHMNDAAHARAGEIEAAGLLVAYDGFACTL